MFLGLGEIGTRGVGNCLGLGRWDAAVMGSSLLLPVGPTSRVGGSSFASMYKSGIQVIRVPQLITQIT